MKIKNKKVSRLVSLLVVSVLTFTFLFLTEERHLFDFFKTGQKLYITFLVGQGVPLIIIGLVLLVKTSKQHTNKNEILKTKHADLGVYNKVRNPYYSSAFFKTQQIFY